jgi:hypothetical protein
MESTKCSKCSGRMDEGFIADHNLTNVIPSIWVGGSPERSFWTGKAGAKISGRAKRQVQTYRCVECGYLESFAIAEWSGS